MIKRIITREPYTRSADLLYLGVKTVRNGKQWGVVGGCKIRKSAPTEIADSVWGKLEKQLEELMKGNQ